MTVMAVAATQSFGKWNGSVMTSRKHAKAIEKIQIGITMFRIRLE